MLLRQIYPLIQATYQVGADAVLTGNKATDGIAFAAMGVQAHDETGTLGFTRYNPLYHWTNDDVYAYIATHEIELPPHYQWKRTLDAQYRVPDCMRCTWQPEHWRLLREQYPDVYEQHWPETKRVYEALAVKQWEYTKRLMRVVMED